MTMTMSITITVIKAIGSMTNSLRVATKKMMHDIDLRCEITIPLQSDNVFSICDYAGCNSAKSLQIEILTVLLIFSGIALIL